MLLALKDSLLNSAFVVENLCGEFKRSINYDNTKLGNSYATTWLIFAGLVTYSDKIRNKLLTIFCALE